MKESIDFITNTSFELKNGKGNLVPFKGQSISFRKSIEEVQFFQMPMTLKKLRYETQLKPKTQNNKNENHNRKIFITPKSKNS